jgi:hypothetical protein
MLGNMQNGMQGFEATKMEVRSRSHPAIYIAIAL